MAQDVLNPCPICGKQFGFQLTGCMTFVAEMLLATSGGKCPTCGTMVVVDEPPQLHPLAALNTEAERFAVRIVDLPLSVGCKVSAQRMGITTVGELLQLPLESARQGFDRSDRFDEIQTMLAQHGLRWVE